MSGEQQHDGRNSPPLSNNQRYTDAAQQHPRINWVPDERIWSRANELMALFERDARAPEHTEAVARPDRDRHSNPCECDTGPRDPGLVGNEAKSQRTDAQPPCKQ